MTPIKAGRVAKELPEKAKEKEIRTAEQAAITRETTPAKKTTSLSSRKNK
jgi:hypothetical protein